MDPVRGRRRGGRWTKLSHGLYRPSDDPGGPHEDLLAWRLVLPASGAFTHLTAAREYARWLPSVPDDLPVFVAMQRSESRPQREGLVVCRQVDPPPQRDSEGVPVTEPAETLLACARDLALLDLVVLCDAALHMGTCSLSDLRAVCRPASARGTCAAARPGPRRRRSESAWETLLRMLHVACDVAVEPQRELYDADGGFLARADLLVSGTHSLHPLLLGSLFTPTGTARLRRRWGARCSAVAPGELSSSGAG